MTFKEQQEKIIQFITNNYNDFLPTYLQNPTYTKSFLDFDKFKDNFTVFFDFARIDFRQSNYDDDCGDIEHLSIIIYLVHRNNNSEVLQNNNLESAYSFYTMIKENIGIGVAQNTTIESIDFYNYAEGNKYLVVTEINLSLEIETI
jgi:hypothetical protein